MQTHKFRNDVPMCLGHKLRAREKGRKIGTGAGRQGLT